MVNWRQFTEEIKASWNSDNNENDIRDRLIADCLILDEVDLVRTVNGSGKWYVEQLYDVIDASMALERNGARRPLVFILHRTPREFVVDLAKNYGDVGRSIASRLEKRSEMVSLDFSNVPEWKI